MIRVLVDITFISGNLEGITLNRYHLYDIPESTLADAEKWLQDVVAFGITQFDISGNKYRIFDYHLEEIKDEK